MPSPGVTYGPILAFLARPRVRYTVSLADRFARLAWNTSKNADLSLGLWRCRTGRGSLSFVSPYAPLENLEFESALCDAESPSMDVLNYSAARLSQTITNVRRKYLGGRGHRTVRDVA